MTMTKPKVTPQLIQEAKQKPNEWISQMDMGIKKLGYYVYPETIIGYWLADRNGELTGDYKPNLNYIPYKIADRKPRDYMTRNLPSTATEEWCVEVDPKYDHLFPNFPEEGIIGDWFIGKDGYHTGHFRPNPKYSGDIKT